MELASQGARSLREVSDQPMAPKGRLADERPTCRYQSGVSECIGDLAFVERCRINSGCRLSERNLFLGEPFVALTSEVGHAKSDRKNALRKRRFNVDH